MNRQLFTAADIRTLVRERKADVLVLGAWDLITPEARDVARDLGVRIVRERGDGAPPAPPPLRKLPPLVGIRRTAVTLEAFGAEIPKTAAVRLRDVVTQSDGSPMAAGYMALDATQPGGGVFPWTLTYDEVDIVMNPHLAELLSRTDDVMAGRVNGNHASLAPSSWDAPRRRWQVGVDLGTAYTVLIVLDEQGQPVAGAYEFAQVVRDGLVVDFVGAVELLRRLKQQVEAQLGEELTSATSAYPPGVPQAEVRATANVLYAAGLECAGLIDEPSAANNVLRLHDGAIVDVGGGTTGVAVIENGQVVYTADEATGGTHFTLVIAGAKNLSFEQAERVKVDPAQQKALFPVVRPVMEKVATITARHIAGRRVERLYLVGGACAFPGMERVIEEVTGMPTCLPGNPLFITPLGIALEHGRLETGD